MTLNRTGIMFSDLPTIADVDAAEYTFRYSVDLPDEMNAWHVVASDPHCLRYGDEDSEAMDQTNWDAIIASLSTEPVDVEK
jgi:hypothetical protein